MVFGAGINKDLEGVKGYRKNGVTTFCLQLVFSPLGDPRDLIVRAPSFSNRTMSHIKIIQQIVGTSVLVRSFVELALDLFVCSLSFLCKTSF